MAAEPDRKFKIGDVCKQADVQPYVLRYWETEFPALAPDKSGGGQRTYTQRDIDVITRIKELLYTEGFTIAGAKKKLDAELKDDGTGKKAAAPLKVVSPVAAAAANPRATKVIQDVSRELRALLDLLK